MVAPSNLTIWNSHLSFGHEFISFWSTMILIYGPHDWLLFVPSVVKLVITDGAIHYFRISYRFTIVTSRWVGNKIIMISFKIVANRWSESKLMIDSINMQVRSVSLNLYNRRWRVVQSIPNPGILYNFSSHCFVQSNIIAGKGMAVLL